MKQIIAFLFYCIFFVPMFCSGRSFDGPGGHAYDFRHVLEGCTGERLEELYKEISKGIDKSFYDNVRKKLGNVSGNHRIIGHWGFEGAIPFNNEPWKSQLAKYPKEQLIKMWQDFTNSLIKSAMEKTGLPQQQAKGLVGLLYNVHLLGDRVYGNVRVNEVVKPDLIIKDIGKNLHRLFGNNSNLAKTIMEEISQIPRNCVYASKCDQAIKILYKHQLGAHIYNTYQNQLSKKGISYVVTLTKKMMLKANTNVALGTNLLVKEVTPYLCGHTGRSVKTVGKNIRFVMGVLQKITVKGKPVLVLSIPMAPTSLIKTGLKAGLYTGVATFVFSEGISIYRFAKGSITEDEFLRQSIKNLGSALLVGAATFVCVALGASPYGWVVAGACIGTAIIVDLAFEYLYKEFKTPIITMDDILGKLPSDLQRRPNIWDYSGFEYLHEQNEKRLNMLSKMNKKNIISIPSRPTIWTENERTTVLGN